MILLPGLAYFHGLGIALEISIETAGTFDLDAELKIWVSSETVPSIRKKFNKSVNIFEVQKVLSHHVLR
ncbi:hypothetical protein IWX76_000118 [Pedobacter sp. CAN_A7]|uniref:PH domain-containing protein n=1 Tax=Pedobacter sp. CAN_A7 TaxID=2787722 RepID=UPI0018CAE3AD